MNNVIVTLKKELKLIIRDKKSLLMMAITPLFIPIFVILMSYVYEELTVNTKEKTYEVGVNYNLSEEEKELSNKEIKYIKYNDKTELEKAYKNNKIIAYIIKEENNYNIYTNTQSEDGSIITTYIMSYLENYNN